MTSDELLQKITISDLDDVLRHLYDGAYLRESLKQKMQDLHISLTENYREYESNVLLMGFSVGSDLFAIRVWTSSYGDFETVGNPFRTKKQTRQITITEWVKDE